ncbi:MAG: metallopeptidase TldD-related protein [Pontiellaceae bacterium]|nr:metallopeptidase TldD-related protein [Pontiellaceae bacterium]
MAEFNKQSSVPYFISYRVDELYTVNISSDFGNLSQSTERKRRILTVSVRVGGYELDNSHIMRDDNNSYFRFDEKMIELPTDDEPEAIKQVLWNETNKKYMEAVEKLAKVKANIAVKVEEEDKSSDFSKEEAVQYYEAPVKAGEIALDKTAWEEKIRSYSLPFLDNKDVCDGWAGFNFEVLRKYFVSSEGTRIVQNRTAARVSTGGKIKAADGMEMPLYNSYFAFHPGDLPKDSIIMNDTKKTVQLLVELKNAPVVNPYSGPALLSGESSGVFFHEIFGHRVEGQRMKDEKDAQTFKKKVGELVLPADISVIFEPALTKAPDGRDLNGYYLYDDQGVKGLKTLVVENGVLKGFLMSRCPINNFPNSNGHGRAAAGRQPVARQSNMIIQTADPKSFEELKNMLIEECRKQGKEYGYYFDKVTGGFTMTGRFIPNAFNVTPNLVYRIYVDGRPDEIVRGVDLVGTPLAMFAQIAAAGNDPDIFTGYCGAESGAVPVSSVSPTLFVKTIEMQKKSKSQERLPILPRPEGKPSVNTSLNLIF